MSLGIPALLAALALALLASGVLAQVRVARLRRSWRLRGLDLVEPGTGLLTLAAVPVRVEPEIRAAAERGDTLALVVLRRLTHHPEQFAARIGALARAHEDAVRVDVDLVAVPVHVGDRDEAVAAAARLGRDLAPDGARDLRIGIALAPDDGDDFLELVDVATRRMRAAAIYDAVASELVPDAVGTRAEVA